MPVLHISSDERFYIVQKMPGGYATYRLTEEGVRRLQYNRIGDKDKIPPVLWKQLCNSREAFIPPMQPTMADRNATLDLDIHTETVKPIMENSMKDKILRGTITNKETGETYDLEPFYMFFNNCQLNVIAKIIWVKSYYDKTKEVRIKCWALDCQGNVFKLDLYFLPDSLDQEQEIISDLPEDKILVVTGQFSFTREEWGITLHDVKYSALPTDISLEEVVEVFRFNSVSMIKGMQEAAEQGDMDRQIELGYMYRMGRGVPQNNSEAAKWIRMAAEQGNAPAQYNIGDMYKEGRGVPQDYSEAIKWFRMAAEQGQANALLELDKIKDK